jgi:hypothetical protein
VNLLVQTPQPATKLFPDLGVESAEGLVEQEHLRLDRQRAGQRDSLTLPSGQFGRPPLGQHIELHQME